MKLSDIPLQIDQNILVSSTLRDPNAVLLKLHYTQVHDVEGDGENVHVRMYPSSRWGACPTRELSDVVYDEESFRRYCAKETEQDIRKGPLFFKVIVQDSRIQIAMVRRRGVKESLREGSYEVFEQAGMFGRSWKVPAGRAAEHGFHLFVAEAVEEMWGTVKAYLDGVSE